MKILSKGKYKTVAEKNTEYYVQQMQDGYTMCKDLLFRHGGRAQAIGYLQSMLHENALSFSDLLGAVTSEAENCKELVDNGGIVSVSRFTFGKKLEKYACLDKDLKFCVKEFGAEEWEDVLYVFPYMNVTKAFDVTFKYEV